ncbi:hypothetical protein [Pseudooceanicola sp. C21-150M6]|uniref:hypothetical protein n=1 Tax=Pseudooceanicola sp. C21-150M6 TaxID=3434355 RepID=UPI003D7FAAC8
MRRRVDGIAGRAEVLSDSTEPLFAAARPTREEKAGEPTGAVMSAPWVETLLCGGTDAATE